LPITILRPSSSFGYIPRRTVIERATLQMLTQKEVYLGNPEAKRDFLYVKDHVSAYLSCIENEKAIGQVFNVCTGELRTIREAIEEIARELDFKGTIHWSTQPKRPGEAPVLRLSNEKIRKLIGWAPKYSFREGVREMVMEWRKRNEVRN